MKRFVKFPGCNRSGLIEATPFGIKDCSTLPIFLECPYPASLKLRRVVTLQLAPFSNLDNYC